MAFVDRVMVILTSQYPDIRALTLFQLRLSRLQEAFTTILECIGEDPNRDGLKETPTRAAKSMMFLTKGSIAVNELLSIISQNRSSSSFS